MTIRDLSSHVPRAPLACGAAGVAFVLARIGRDRGDSSVLATSKRWLRIAQRAAKQGRGFRAKGWSAAQHSVMLGPIGLAATAALVSPSVTTAADYVAVARRRAARGPSE
jgi:hypothetical protein